MLLSVRESFNICNSTEADAEGNNNNRFQKFMNNLKFL